MVVFISGKDYNRFDAEGKRVPARGRVIAVSPREGKLKVEGANIIKKHTRPNPQADKKGGIIELENWVDISNVKLIDPETGKPTRVRYQFNDEGKKERVAVKSGKVI